MRNLFVVRVSPCSRSNNSYPDGFLAGGSYVLYVSGKPPELYILPNEWDYSGFLFTFVGTLAAYGIRTKSALSSDSPLVEDGLPFEQWTLSALRRILWRTSVK